MIFEENKTLDRIFTSLFDRYKENVPDVSKITNALIEKKVINDQRDIVNDHVAFRTMGVANLGIASFEKIFLKHGYTPMDTYFFEKKRLNSCWYAPPSDAYPRIFISELRVDDLPKEQQTIIRKYTDGVTSDPVDQLDLDNAESVGHFFHKPLWNLPSKKDYQQLLEVSEYAAWVIYNRYYLNHYTISVHELDAPYNSLEKFNEFLEKIGVKLNDAGGIIKMSGDELLLQSSTVANVLEAEFADGEKLSIAGSYVEFAERRVLPEFAHLAPDQIKRKNRREGFETGNADKIFESTYSSQVGKN